MKIITTLIAIALSLNYGMAQAEMHKCVGKDGKQVYQATKCPSDAADVKTITPAAKLTEEQEQSATIKAEQDKKDADIIIAVRKHKLLPGMTKQQAIESVGSPTSINNSQYGTVRREQWVYSRSTKTKVLPSSYLYFENDILTSMQWAE